jgi:molybdopterin converting factor subunit 1
MRVLVRYFAAAREAAGRESETVEVGEGQTVKDLLALLGARHPGLAAALPTLRCAVDRHFADPEAPLAEGAEVALIPPVGGG